MGVLVSVMLPSNPESAVESHRAPVGVPLPSCLVPCPPFALAVGHDLPPFDKTSKQAKPPSKPREGKSGY